MKVFLITDYRGKLPSILKQFYINETMTWRYGDVVEFVEKTCIPQTNKPLIEHNEPIIKIETPHYYDGDAYMFTEDHILCCIVDVDISRPWTIKDYDGCEYIQYLDYVTVDPVTNYCELP